MCMLKLLSVFCLCLVLNQCSVKKALYRRQEKVKLEIPVTYALGWWSNQDKLQIDSFSVEILQSTLSLFNTKSLVAYTIRGHLPYQGEWKPYIQKIHINEHFIPSEGEYQTAEEIDLTPIVNVQVDHSKTGGTEYFCFTNQLYVHSFHWGENTVKFVCGKMEKTIQVMQKK